MASLSHGRRRRDRDGHGTTSNRESGTQLESRCEYSGTGGNFNACDLPGQVSHNSSVPASHSVTVTPTADAGRGTVTVPRPSLRTVTQAGTASEPGGRGLVLHAAGLAAMQRGNDHCYMESSQVSLISNTPGVYKPPAVPSGAAQGAHYPAGTRGDIPAVNVCVI